MTDTYRLRANDRAGHQPHRPRLCDDCGRSIAAGIQCPRCQRHTLAMLARAVDRRERDTDQ